MTYPEKHIALVCNPTHENLKSLKLTDNISVLLSGMDIKHSIFTTHWPEVWDGITEAWIVGGDGTLNFFINRYPGIQLPLSVFAGGSGNDFHWMLYGEMDIEKQVELVLDAQPAFIDAGICNGMLFLNGVGIGFDGAIVHDLLGKKKLAGKGSYMLSILKNILAYQEKPCTFQMDNETITENCLLASVANAKRYGGGFKVAPQASIDDSLLDLNIVGKISPLKRIRYLPIIEKGEHLDLDFVQYRQLNRVKITSPAALHAHIDGEYLQDSEFDIEILPKRFAFLF